MSLWQEVKLALSTGALVLITLITAHATMTDQSRIDKAADHETTQQQSNDKSIYTPGGGGICNGCTVVFKWPD